MRRLVTLLLALALLTLPVAADDGVPLDLLRGLWDQVVALVSVAAPEPRAATEATAAEEVTEDEDSEEDQLPAPEPNVYGLPDPGG